MEEEISRQVVMAEAENKKMQQEMEELQSVIKRQEESILSGSRSLN
jgi:peptidoglycan hydrolase CwlO-like protein